MSAWNANKPWKVWWWAKWKVFSNVAEWLIMKAKVVEMLSPNHWYSTNIFKNNFSIWFSAVQCYPSSTSSPFWFDEQLFSSSVDLCLHLLVYSIWCFLYEKMIIRIFIEKLVCLSFFIDYTYLLKAMVHRDYRVLLCFASSDKTGWESSNTWNDQDCKDTLFLIGNKIVKVWYIISFFDFKSGGNSRTFFNITRILAFIGNQVT